MNLRNFFSELKRRNVYKVAVAYIVAGWALSQGIAQVFPVFDIPNWVIRLIVLLIIIGLPIALVLAWMFELTPQGIKRTETADAMPIATTGYQKHAWIYIVVLGAVISVSLFFIGRYTAGNRISASANDISNKSIAVLPFENLSSDKENAYFADGIQDEILTRLSKIAALKVISRTSTQKYKSAPDNLREVGKQLGVANLLEGSVQKIANAVHIDVQLIRAATDEHLWAESYNRKLDDVFAVEGEVASAIADQLNAKLSGSEKQELTAKPTSNPEAYDAYLRGLAFFRKSDDASFLSAEQFLKQAVQLDPSFAVAWALLVRTEAVRYFNGVDATDERRAAIRAALDKAVRLQPELAEVQLAQGYYEYWVERDYDAARARFEQLVSKWPNNAEALEALGLILRRQGHWEEGGAYLDRAVALDPRSPSPRLNAIEVRLFTQNFPKALHDIDEALNNWPDNPTFLSDKVFVYLQQGQLKEAEAAVAGLHPRPTDSLAVVAIRNLAVARHSYPAAIAQLEVLLQLNQATSPNDYNSCFLNLSLGELRRLSGDAIGAQRNYIQARDALLPLIKNQPANSALYDSIAFVYAGLGDREAAMKNIDHAIQLVPIEKDALQGMFWESDRALLQARFGDRERAIPALERLLKIPGFLTPTVLRFIPDFDPLRGDPRFEKLCQEKP
jgi:TolB-like protein/predicted Zn-dependent protease